MVTEQPPEQRVAWDYYVPAFGHTADGTPAKIIVGLLPTPTGRRRAVQIGDTVTVYLTESETRELCDALHWLHTAMRECP